MQEQIRMTTAVATVLWAAGLGLVAAGIVTDRNGFPGLGVLTGMAAMLVQIRGYLTDHETCLRHAFDLGRDYERGVAEVRSLR